MLSHISNGRFKRTDRQEGSEKREIPGKICLPIFCTRVQYTVTGSNYPVHALHSRYINLNREIG